jgi:hypothetical protein
MKFIAGSVLTKELKRLASSHGPKKIAISYWGDRALSLLPLKPDQRGIQIICCLKGGKSSPDVIKRFGKNAKQLDRLHAKVLWTHQKAIVSSANASSNGLPEEESLSNGLIEAGMLLDRREDLLGIERWFDGLWRSADRISPADLAAAREARKARGASGSRPELIDLPSALLEKAPLGVIVYENETTREEDREVKQTKSQFLELDEIEWYVDSPKEAKSYPARYKHAYYVLEFKATRDFTRFQYTGVLRFFPQTHFAKTKTGFVPIFCQYVDHKEIPTLPPFRIGKRTKDALISRLKARLQATGKGQRRTSLGFAAWEPIGAFLRSKAT